MISRTSTLRYKSSPDNIPEIARQLGVEHVLEGGVQKAGDKARVTVQLIHGATDSHVWAETYDRKLSDILEVESEIADTIAKELKAKLTPREQKAVAAKPTDNFAAYEEYLRGLALWNRLTLLPNDVDQIIQHFSRAVELDPAFALGWSFLSVAHSYRYGEFDPTPAQAARRKRPLAKRSNSSLIRATVFSPRECITTKSHESSKKRLMASRKHDSARPIATWLLSSPPM